MWTDTVGSERESHHCGSFSHLRGISSGFPLVSHIALPGSESVVGISRVLPCVYGHLLAKVDFSEEAYG